MNDNNNNPSNTPSHRIVSVTLTPLANFFFGGQKQTEVESEKDYYIKSLFYPQQTVILGMLRQELLMQNHLFPLGKSDNDEKKNQAAQLIGESSFQPSFEIGDQDFGAIEELSPVFITNKERVFHVLPADYGFPYSPKEDGQTFFNHPHAETKPFLPYLDKYKSKDRPPDRLVSKESPEMIVELKDLFIPDEQIGITKGKNGQTPEDGYYKQVFYRLRKGYAFAFYLKLKTTVNKEPVKFDSNFVFFGGERSPFKMDIKEEDANQTVARLFDQTLPQLEGSKILLTSDAFVQSSILNACDFSVSESVYSRNFRSNVRTTHHYSNLSGKENQIAPHLGDPHNLLARGTVLYYGNRPETLTTLTGLLDKPGNKKIGFNYYKIYPSQEEKGKE